MVGKVSLGIKRLEVELDHFSVDEAAFLDFIKSEEVSSGYE